MTESSANTVGTVAPAQADFPIVLPTKIAFGARTSVENPELLTLLVRVLASRSLQKSAGVRDNSKSSTKRLY
jgi:hypothetical protein